MTVAKSLASFVLTLTDSNVTELGLAEHIKKELSNQVNLGPIVVMFDGSLDRCHVDLKFHSESFLRGLKFDVSKLVGTLNVQN